MGDLVGLRKNFFPPEPLVIEYFSLTYKAIVWQVFPWKIFLVLKIRLQDVFFLKSPIPPPPPSKVKPSAPCKLFAHDRPYWRVA